MAFLNTRKWLGLAHLKYEKKNSDTHDNGVNIKHVVPCIPGRQGISSLKLPSINNDAFSSFIVVYFFFTMKFS